MLHDPLQTSHDETPPTHNLSVQSTLPFPVSHLRDFVGIHLIPITHLSPLQVQILPFPWSQVDMPPSPWSLPIPGRISLLPCALLALLTSFLFAHLMLLLALRAVHALSLDSDHAGRGSIFPPQSAGCSFWATPWSSSLAKTPSPLNS